MGRKGGGKRRLVTLKQEDSITLGTLANNTIVLQTVPFAIKQNFYCVSMDIWADIRGLTTGETPIKIGVASADLTNVEISEALDATQNDPGDEIAKERGRRPVRTIGRFSGSGASIGMNDGEATRTKVRRKFFEDLGMVIWAQNKTGATLTTGALVSFQVNYYGFWI